jgi:hypothetical protein
MDGFLRNIDFHIILCLAVGQDRRVLIFRGWSSGPAQFVLKCRSEGRLLNLIQIYQAELISASLKSAMSFPI